MNVSSVSFQWSSSIVFPTADSSYWNIWNNKWHSQADKCKHWCECLLAVLMCVFVLMYSVLCVHTGNDGDDFLVLGLRSGRVLHRFNLGSDVATIVSNPIDRRLTVHTVIFGRSKTAGWLKVSCPSSWNMEEKIRKKKERRCLHLSYRKTKMLLPYHRGLQWFLGQVWLFSPFTLDSVEWCWILLN